jgi:Zn-finger nucleic acid-binding protein
MKSKMFCGCEVGCSLLSSEIAPGLPSQRCSRCHGHWLRMADYELWRTDATPVQEHQVPPMRAEAGATARACPACERMMTRWRVGASPDFRLDRCAGCKAVWFDAGEWPALVRAGLAQRLSEVLSDTWQRRVQSDELSARRLAGLRARHGQECMNELERMRTWLEAQPQREELLALLRAGW